MWTESRDKKSPLASSIRVLIKEMMRLYLDGLNRYRNVMLVEGVTKLRNRGGQKKRRRRGLRLEDHPVENSKEDHSDVIIR